MKENLRILKVLMWKHMVVRRRKYINTIIELILTCSLFVLLYLLDVYVLRPVIMNMPTSTETSRTITRSAVELDSLVAPERIFYTPDNDLTWSLMSFVGKNLKLKRLKKLPGPTHKGFLAINNASELGDFYNNLTFFDALVIFNNMDNGTLPERLNYTIRVKSNNYFTSTYEPQSAGDYQNVIVGTDKQIAKHHELFGTIYEPFLRLQWAVDSSYLQMKTGKAVLKKIFLRELPYDDLPQGAVLIKALMITLAILTALIGLEVTFMNIITRTCTERTAGVQELMKISGASTAMIYMSHYINSLVMGIPFAIIATIFLSIGENPIVEDFNPFLLFITFVMYFLSIMAFGLAVGGALNSADHAVSISLTVYSASLVIALVIFEVEVFNTFFLFIIGLVPHVPLVRFFYISAAFGSDFSWVEPINKFGSLLLVYPCLIVQTLLFFFIAWYLYNVHPGRYGVALPWNFIFMKDYWVRKKLSEADLIELQETAAQRDPRYFEPMRPDEQVGIRIANLSKIYKSLGKQPVPALSDVSIDVCKDGITVLLGHNGAGKTTLLDIITGMQSATSGEVYVNGHHFVWERAAIRKELGYCPQHNLLFADLNVIEHLMFFSMLRGESRKGARVDAKRILADMNLVERAKAVPSALSGGMARRLQMGCALAGHTSVLLLDEPTSSLDVKSRRALWDVLMGLRGSSTILLSTHFLEEADALGARVCALRRGALACDASPLHLKRSIGEGYYLTIGGGNAKLAPTISSIIPTAHFHRMTPTSVTYALPHSETKKLPQLFVQLEARRAELGIVSMGVSAPSLDEVFLKLCYDGVITDSYDEVDRREFFVDTSTKFTGVRLWWRQFIVLCKRQLLFMWRMKVMMFLYIFFPIAMIVLVVCTTNNAFSEIGGQSARSPPPVTGPDSVARNLAELLNPARELSLHIYKRLPHVKVMYNLDDSYAQSLGINGTDNVNFVTSDNVFEEALRQLKKDASNYERNLMGIEVNDTSAQILYSTAYRHIAPVALNLVSNLIAQQTLTDASSNSLRTVTTINHPMTTAYDGFFLRATPIQPKSMLNVKLLASRLALLLLSSLFFVSTLLKKERESGARNNYLRAGVSSTLFWCGTLLMHMLVFIVIFLPAYLLAMGLLDTDNTLTTKEVLLTMTITLLVSAAATFTFHYFLHEVLPNLFTVVYCIFFVFYMLFMIPFIVTKRAEAIANPDTPKSAIMKYLELLVYLFPFNHVGLAISMAAYTAQLNAYCRLNRAMCPNIPVAEPGFDPKQCCSSSDEYLKYFSSFEMSPSHEVLVLIVMIIVYMGVFRRRWEALKASRYAGSGRVAPAEDDAVAAERRYVADQLNNVKKDGISDALLMSDVHKKYDKFCGKDVVALEGVSLSVRQGECFGILGVNGAGKTSAFKTIVGEVAPTRGEFYINGYSLKKERAKYLKCVSYCQQYGGVDSFMTGRQCLESLLTVSGYKPELVKSEAKAWLECVDMSRYGSARVESYSGGCARRVAAAAALCGARPLVLLDEPSSGVDTVARHRLWRAVQRSLRYSAVVLTSHSMDEMEALCARMALLRGGRVTALGDAHALRHAHAHGHALVLRLTHGASANREDLVSKLKEDVEQNFDCTLKQEHSNQLDYHINQTMSYSEIFTKLEALKATHHAILDDYCVNETTLEEVFLAFAEGAEVGNTKDV